MSRNATLPASTTSFAGGDYTVPLGLGVSLVCSELGRVHIEAEGVPPTVVATALDHFELGRLRDYDVAELRADWRERVFDLHEQTNSRSYGAVIEIDVWY